MRFNSYNGAYNCSGEYIRIARKKQRPSQELLAVKIQLTGLDIDRKTVSRIETGKRVIPDYELPFYANELGVSILWLLGIED